jgi:hypothetical protein
MFCDMFGCGSVQGNPPASVRCHNTAAVKGGRVRNVQCDQDMILSRAWMFKVQQLLLSFPPMLEVYEVWLKVFIVFRKLPRLADYDLIRSAASRWTNRSGPRARGGCRTCTASAVSCKCIGNQMRWYA